MYPLYESRLNPCTTAPKPCPLDEADPRAMTHSCARSRRTARLWHMREFGCLRVFLHPDFVTSVRFHPSISGLFATGCADGRVRLWDATLAGADASDPKAGGSGSGSEALLSDSGASGAAASGPSRGAAPGGLVATAAVQQDMVTAVEFMPDGRRIVVGTMRGVCRCEQAHVVWVTSLRSNFASPLFKNRIYPHPSFHCHRPSRRLAF